MDGEPYTPLAPRNPRVAAFRRLLAGAESRREAGALVVEGAQLIGEALDAGWPLRSVMVAVDDDGRVADRARGAWTAALAAGADVVPVRPSVLASTATTDTPQPVLGRFDVPEGADRVPHGGVVLRLEGVHDPGNVGTLVRSAAALGAAAVVLIGGADPTSPKVVRASAGACFRIPVVRRAPGERTDRTGGAGPSGRRTVGLVPAEAPPLEQVDLSGDVELVVGHEAHGLAPEVVGELDAVATIPMLGGVESLNAAVAGAIALYEAARQRRRRAEPVG